MFLGSEYYFQSKSISKISWYWNTFGEYLCFPWFCQSKYNRYFTDFFRSWYIKDEKLCVTFLPVFCVFIENIFFSKSPKSKVIIKHKKLYCHQQKPELLSKTSDFVPKQEERWHWKRRCFLNVSLASIVWKSPRGKFDNKIKNSGLIFCTTFVC